MLDTRTRFDLCYRLNSWGDPETRSGPGSRRDSECVAHTIDALVRVVDQHAVVSIADIPCGDFNWMPLFLARRPAVRYRGYDIVETLITDNRRRNPTRHFDVLDITRAVPPAADLIVCKDLLNHLRHADVACALANIAASGSRLLLASNNFDHQNADLAPYNILPGASRHLDICKAPFDSRPPIWRSHYLGLWKVADLAPAR